MSDDTIADIIATVLTIIMVAIIVWLIFALLNLSENNHDNDAWNNGHCECGGNWEYEQAVGHRYDTSYIYVCDECGKRIELFEMR